MENNIAVYNSRLAKILVNRGFRIVDIVLNRKNFRDLVFFFEPNETIWNIIKEYEAIARQHKQQMKKNLLGVGSHVTERDNPENK